MDRKGRILVWLSSHQMVKPTGIESVLGIPKRSIIVNKGIIPTKHLDRIEELLMDYGYMQSLDDVCPREDTLQNGEEYILGEDYRLQERMSNNLWRTLEYSGKSINIV